MNVKEENKKYFRIGSTIFLTACAIILVYYLIFHLDSIRGVVGNFFTVIMPIVDGIVLAYLLSPVVNFFEQKIIYKYFYDKVFHNADTAEKKNKVKKRIRAMMIVLTYVILLTLLYLLIKALIPQLLTSIQNIVKQFPGYWDNFIDWINELFEKYPILESNIHWFLEEHQDNIASWLNENVISKANGWVGGLTSGTFSVLKALLNIIIGIIVSIYLMSAKEMYSGQAKKIVYAFMNRDRANSFIHKIRFTNQTFLKFFGSKIIDSFIIGVLCFILMSILRLPYVALISVIIGVTNIIPYFGPFIGAIPSAFLVLLVNPKQCIIFVIMILVLQQFDGNILGPRIMSQSIGISSFWIIFSITLFGGYWGFIGMLVGVPVFAVIYAGVGAYINARLEEKELTRASEKYIELDFIDKKNTFVMLTEPPEVKHFIKKDFDTPAGETTETNDMSANQDDKIE